MPAVRLLTPDRLRALVIGTHDAVETRFLREAVQECLPAHELRAAATAAEALALLDAADWWPELVIVAQRWSDEFTAAEIQSLLARAPLARWIVCYGAWCASDGRTRSLWPMAIRVPVDALAARLRAELDVLHGRRAPLPLTASRDEVFLFDPEAAARAV